jgi:hypothetical protein
MIKYKNMLSPLILVIILVTSVNLFSQGKKSMEVGDIDWVLKDNLDEGEWSWGWGETRAWNDGYFDGIYAIKGTFLGCKDWQDEGGSNVPVKISGIGLYEANEALEVMAIPDAAGFTINRYYRYQPPTITVDGIGIEARYPVDDADHVDPGRMPGNADGLIESMINTNMGVSIRHRAIGFSQQNHDKYLIREFILKNTGNIDMDPDIELPNNFIDDLYFLRSVRAHELLKPWYSAIGIMPGEDLRICYGYSARSLGTMEDDFGGSMTTAEDWAGLLLYSFFYGEQTIFASAAANDFSNDDTNQPQMTAYTDTDYFPTATNALNLSEGEQAQLYQLMSEGAAEIEGYFQPQQPGSKTGRHSVPLDQRGFAHPSEMESYGWTANVLYSIGPYDLNIGDSVKIVIAEVYGNLSGEMRYQVAKDWQDNKVTWQGPDILPQQYIDNPGLTVSTDGKTEAANRSKDNWIYTAYDSMITTASNAESYPTFSGYRVYRSLGSWTPEGEGIGEWKKVYECGGNSGNPVVNEWQDETARRAEAYYYAVTSFDDGSQTNFKGGNEILESNPILNHTTQAAFKLFTPGESLDDIVVVPNPYNLSATNQNFPGEGNKIMFYGLPLKCTIRIFTEAGDLIRVIEHEGSGDHPWGEKGIEQTYLATDVGQIVVSGLYIAHIETPDGQSTVRKFIVVR